MKNRLTLATLALALVFGVGACNDSSPSSPSTPTAEFQNNSRQVGLVNVSAGDVALLNNVNLAVAANVIANLCGITVPVAVLAQQVITDGSETFCTINNQPITVDQSGGNQPIGLGGGNNSSQAGLVNVSLGNVAILNNVNAAIAANVLVSACGLTVPAAILAVQTVGVVTTTVCTIAAGPINIIQG